MIKLAHIGIATDQLQNIQKFYEDLLEKPVDSVEEVPSENVRTAFFDVDGIHVELLEPTSDQGAIAKYIQKKGKGGIHHIAFEVDDLEKAMARLKGLGYRLTSDHPQPGAHQTKVTFVHPQSSGGVLIELIEV